MAGYWPRFLHNIWPSWPNKLGQYPMRMSGCFENKAPAKRDRNISTQHIATLLGATYCVRLAIMLWCVATCWVLLAQIWKWTNLWMLHDVVVVWPGCAQACAPVRFLTRNMSQHVATGWPNACNMLRQTMLRYVAIFWPELATAGLTMLGYIALRCCYRLAGA